MAIAKSALISIISIPVALVAVACGGQGSESVGSTSEELRTARTMPESCRQTLLAALSEGSAQASGEEIVKSLGTEWKKNSKRRTVHYDECGSSDFFYITVRKSTCKIEEMESGDSDGECE